MLQLRSGEKRAVLGQTSKGNPSKFLAVVHAAVYHLVAQSLVRALGERIVNQGIGSHLQAPVAPRPILRLSEQALAYAEVALVRSHIPTLDVPYWMQRVAAIGLRKEVHFHDADHSSVACHCDKDDEWHG